jgi:hypothetical protein
VGLSHESALADILQRLTRLEQSLQPYTPITPLYSLEQACTLLPTRLECLRQMLSQYRDHLDPPMYRQDFRHRRYRMLSHTDMLFLRRHLVRPRRTRVKAMQDMVAA